MSFSDDEVRELADRFPGTEQAEEAKVTYFRIPDVTLPDGCSPSPMTLLLCPVACWRLRISAVLRREGQNAEGQELERERSHSGSDVACLLLAGEGESQPDTNGRPPFASTGMSITIRLTRKLYEEVLSDLRRPHAHAAERVGFLYGRLASPIDPLILMTRYSPVPDEHYLLDFDVGARINGDAIRAAMQGVVDSGEGVFHTHLHEWPGRPGFSLADNKELPKLVPAFQAVGRTQASGLFLLSPDSAIADVWLPGSQRPERREPNLNCRLSTSNHRRSTMNDRFSRQGFLGEAGATCNRDGSRRPSRPWRWGFAHRPATRPLGCAELRPVRC